MKDAMRKVHSAKHERSGVFTVNGVLFTAHAILGILTMMLYRHEYKNLVWIDLESPTIDEVRAVAEEFGIQTTVADELLTPTLRPHTESYGEYLYLVLHFPVLKQLDANTEQEVDFVIGKRFIVTVRYEALTSFVEFRKVFEVNASIAENHFTDNPFDIFLLLAKRLYRAVEIEIDEQRDVLEDIEREIFQGKEKEMVIALSESGRNILNLKQALDPHQDVLNSLAQHTDDIAGREYVARVRAIESIYFRSRKHITRIWQTLNELRETNNSLLSTKQNEIMKVFTILAFVTFPLSLVASIFGMNTMAMPIVGSPHDFWIVLGLMGVATFFMFLYFRHKKWL